MDATPARAMPGSASRVPAIAVVAGLGLFLVQCWVFRGFFPDDLFITLTYSKNLLGGGGWAFNPGQPSNGATSPAWVLLTTAAGFLSGDLYLSAKALSLLCGLGVLGLALWMLGRVPGDRAEKAGVALLMSLSHWLVFWSVSGMEAALSALLFSIVVAWNLVGARRWSEPTIIGASLCLLVLNVFVRPETVLLLAAYAAVVLVRDPGTAWRPAALAAAVAGAAGGVWAGFALQHFGSVVPNTVLVKQGLPAAFGVGALEASAMRVAGILGPEVVVGLAALAGAAWSRARPPAARVPGFALAWLVMTLTLPALYLYNGAGGGHWATSRYLLPVLPMLGFLGFTALLGLRGLRPLKAGAAAVFLAMQVALAVLHVEPSRNNAEYMRILRDYAGWLGRNTPADATVAAADYGLLAFFSGREVVDLVGLHYPGVRQHRDRWDFVQRARPHYMLVNEFYDFPYQRRALAQGEVVLTRSLRSWNMGLAFDPPVRAVKLVRLRWP
jgi:hypothetical protein